MSFLLFLLLNAIPSNRLQIPDLTALSKYILNLIIYMCVYIFFLFFFLSNSIMVVVMVGETRLLYLCNRQKIENLERWKLKPQYLSTKKVKFFSLHLFPLMFIYNKFFILNSHDQVFDIYLDVIRIGSLFSIHIVSYYSIVTM